MHIVDEPRKFSPSNVLTYTVVSNIGRNPKSFWHYVNSHMKTRSGIDSIRRPNGSTATSDQEKLNY